MTLKQGLSTIIALGIAGAFFSYLGAAPGMEDLFRALMMLVTLTMAILASSALIAIRNKEKSGLTRQSKNRHFYDISLKGECQLW